MSLGLVYKFLRWLFFILYLAYPDLHGVGEAQSLGHIISLFVSLMALSQSCESTFVYHWRGSFSCGHCIFIWR